MAIYLILALGAATNCFRMSIITTGEVVSTSLAVVTLVTCFGFPLYVYIRLFNQSMTPDGQIIENEFHKSEYGVLYEGLRVKHQASLLHPVIYLLRRLGYVLVICMLRSRPLA